MIKKLLLLVALASMLCACAATQPTASDPLSAAEHLRLGGIYEAKGSLALALVEYGKAFHLDETNAAAWFAAGNVELRRANFTEAVQYYKTAIKLRPSEAAYHNNLGWLYMETGDLAEAEAESKIALGLDPSHGYIYLDSLGVIATRLKSFKAAEQYLNEAAKGVPTEDGAGAKEIAAHLQELYKLNGSLEKDAIIEDKTGKGNK